MMRAAMVVLALAGCTLTWERTRPTPLHRHTPVAPMIVDMTIACTGAMVGADAQYGDRRDGTRMAISYGIAALVWGSMFFVPTR